MVQPLPPKFCWHRRNRALPGGGRARPGGAARLDSGLEQEPRPLAMRSKQTRTLWQPWASPAPRVSVQQ